MKKKTIKIRLGTFKFLLFLPILMLSFCDSNLEEPAQNAENRLTKEAKVLSLMKAAVQNDSDQNVTGDKGVLSKTATTEEDDQCTYFLYPMTFEVYSGDNPNPELVEINSDEELIAFIDQFTFIEEYSIATTENYGLYIYFPITLLDADGVETELNDLTELEGTLQMAVEACASLNEESSDDDGDGSDDGSDDDSDDDSDDEDDGDDDEDDGISSENDNPNTYEFCHKNGKKVYICHKGKTICVSVNAIYGHMQHEEDYLGRCDD